MGVRIHEIDFYVDDLRKMVEFYRDVLGVGTKWDMRTRSAVLQHEGIRIVMHERELMPEELGLQPEPQRLDASFMLIIELPYYGDVDREFVWITKAGGRAVQSPQNEGSGRRVAQIADPEGHLVQLQSDNRGSPEWEEFLERYGPASPEPSVN